MTAKYHVVSDDPDSAEFMYAYLKARGVGPGDVNAHPISSEIHGAPAFRIVYPQDGMYRDRIKDGDPKFKGPPGQRGVWFKSVQDYIAWCESKDKLIVEGEVKAAAAQKRLGRPVAGIGGCWNWQSKGVTDDAIRAGTRAGDHLELVLDGDIKENKQVGQSARSFHAWAESVGATMNILHLPESMGMDDWLVTIEGDAKPAFDELPAIDPRTLPETVSSAVVRLDLDTDENGRPLNNATNIERIITDKFAEHLSTDLYLGERFGVARYRDSFDVQLAVAAEAVVKKVSVAHIRPFRQKLLEARRTNLVGDWLKGLRWDKTPRIKTALKRLWGVEDESVYTADVMRYLLCAMISRCLEPGEQADSVVTLVGTQGIGKTRSLSTLAGTMHDHSLCAIVAVDDKALLARAIEEAWLINLDELAGLGRREQADLKNWITQTEDLRNVKYVEKIKRRPRSFVVTATSNDPKFLVDLTGNRRWLPVTCTKIDVAGIAAEREQLFAEAMTLWRRTKWWFAREADSKVEAYRKADPVEQVMLHVIANGPHLETPLGMAFTAVTVANAMGGLDWLDERKANSLIARVGAIAGRLGLSHWRFSASALRGDLSHHFIRGKSQPRPWVYVIGQKKN